MHAEQGTSRLISIIDSLSIGVSIFDTQWHCVYINKKAAELVGRLREELLGKTLWELFPQVNKTVFYSEALRAVEEKKSIYVEFYFPPLDKWFESSLNPSVDGLTILSQDISERKRLETARLHLAAIVNSSEDAILGKTLEGIRRTR